MQNSNGFNKNILILTIVLFALIAALSIMLNLGGNPAAVSTLSLKGNIAVIDKNVAELDGFNTDLSLFIEEDVVSQELDATLSEVGEISNTTAGLTNDEENLDNLAQDLNNSLSDESTNKEVDQALQEVAL